MARAALVLPVTLAKALQQTYQGISPALAQQLGGDRLAKYSVDDLSARTGRSCTPNGSNGCVLHAQTYTLTWLPSDGSTAFGSMQGCQQLRPCLPLACELGAWYSPPQEPRGDWLSRSTTCASN